ncbi:hypothetical protein GOV13_02620 [Candidatus Pacearchaeota archaeon]|nr:hypothetical protein [Candidatus Pacearchaeota archaeon]
MISEFNDWFYGSIHRIIGKNHMVPNWIFLLLWIMVFITGFESGLTISLLGLQIWYFTYLFWRREKLSLRGQSDKEKAIK